MSIYNDKKDNVNAVTFISRYALRATSVTPVKVTIFSVSPLRNGMFRNAADRNNYVTSNISIINSRIISEISEFVSRTTTRLSNLNYYKKKTPRELFFNLPQNQHFIHTQKSKIPTVFSKN